MFNSFAPLRAASLDPDAESRWRRDVMKDLKADWRKWSRVEKIAALFIAAGASFMVPALLLLGQG